MRVVGGMRRVESIEILRKNLNISKLEIESKKGSKPFISYKISYPNKGVIATKVIATKIIATRTYQKMILVSIDGQDFGNIGSWR